MEKFLKDEIARLSPLIDAALERQHVKQAAWDEENPFTDDTNYDEWIIKRINFEE